ncbi:hypothetical protein [Candidatus Nitrospira neomarina]|uniref:N-acetyltransferase domain-containing protein n=1 Tax=Candidatus Nitrospira neomarina TaxID=3020899 RepID=A0AA96JY16_9BACT|nr:hypothetical protein [Candidatus Nitrospira neomarina]WNM64018.1 hypothetical protein PQG83_09755 [Candidatus Nitrospira neomarina]
MVSTERIYSADLPKVLPLLSEFNPQSAKIDWAKLFNYNWEKDEDYCGLGLLHGGNVVGFLGTIFSRRRIKNKEIKFCNLTSWYVKEEFRNKALSLMWPIQRLKDYTVTDLTPTRDVSLILDKLGFDELDSRIRILLPFQCGRRKHDAPSAVFINDGNTIIDLLSDTDSKVFHDHLPSQCKHSVIKDKLDYCYIIYTVISVRKINCAYIHYLSNLDLFLKYNDQFRNDLLTSCNANFIILDSRLVRNENLPSSFTFPVRAPKFFKSSILTAQQIDNLYSELTLLNVSTIPRLRSLVWDARHVLSNWKDHLTKFKRS